MSKAKATTTGFEDSDASNSEYRMNQPTTSILDDPASLFQNAKEKLSNMGASIGMGMGTGGPGGQAEGSR